MTDTRKNLGSKNPRPEKTRSQTDPDAPPQIQQQTVQRTVKQFDDFPVPQAMGVVAQERVRQPSVEQIVNASMPQGVLEESWVARERMQQWTAMPFWKLHVPQMVRAMSATFHN